MWRPGDNFSVAPQELFTLLFETRPLWHLDTGWLTEQQAQWIFLFLPPLCRCSTIPGFQCGVCRQNSGPVLCACVQLQPPNPPALQLQQRCKQESMQNFTMWALKTTMLGTCHRDLYHHPSLMDVLELNTLKPNSILQALCNLRSISEVQLHFGDVQSTRLT